MGSDETNLGMTNASTRRDLERAQRSFCAGLKPMNARTKELLEEVLDLPAEERDAFAAKLLETLEAAPDTRTDEEWAKEIERRADEALDPAWQGRSWEETRDAAEQRLRASRGR